MLFFKALSHYIAEEAWTGHVAQAGFELVLFLTWPPECWDDRHILVFFSSAKIKLVPEVLLRASRLVVTQYTVTSHPKELLGVKILSVSGLGGSDWPRS